MVDYGSERVNLNNHNSLVHGVILLQDQATSHSHCDMQNLVQWWDWEVLEHPPNSPDLTPCD